MTHGEILSQHLVALCFVMLRACEARLLAKTHKPTKVYLLLLKHAMKRDQELTSYLTEQKVYVRTVT